MTQAIVAQRDNLTWEDRDSFNIVMMGMGEPLHNYDNVMKALRILHDEFGFDLGRAELLALIAADQPASSSPPASSSAPASTPVSTAPASVGVYMSSSILLRSA